MLKWSEKLLLLTQKGLSWKEVQEMDKGLDDEKNNPPKEEPPKEEPPKEEPPEEEPTENEKKLLEKIEALETQLKEAQADNVHGNNDTLDTSVSFDEQLNEMFKDIRI